MTIYLDIVFLENMIMNYIIIYATVIVLKNKVSQIRILFGSFIGAIYTVVMYLNILPIYSNFLMKFILSIIIVYVSIKPHTMKKLFKDLIVFYFVSFVFGGCSFALIYCVAPHLALVKNGVFVGEYPLKIAILGGVVSFIVIKTSLVLIKNKLNKKDIIYKLNIGINNKKIEIKALLDTGNLLKEPLTGNSVIIVESRCLKEILPIEIIENISEIINGNMDVISNCENCREWICKLRIIPYESIGIKRGVMLGIRTDYVEVITDEVQKSNENIVIGIYENIFSKYESYSAIFGLDILEGGNKNECISNVKV